MNRSDRRRQAKLDRSSTKTSPKSARALDAVTQAIVTLLNAQEYDRAEKELKDLLVTAADNAELNHLYGLLLCQTSREEDGIRYLLRATSASPKTAIYWYNLATAYAHRKQWDEAISAARKSTSLDASYVDPQYLLTNMLLANEMVEEAVEELTKLAVLQPNDAKLFHELGRRRAAREQWTQAEEAYNRVLELEPENVSAMRELAAIYMNTWQYDAAQRLRKHVEQFEAAGKF